MAVRPSDLPVFAADRPAPVPAWTLWLFFACLLTLPVIAVFAEDRPPRNEVTQEQDPSGGRPRDGAEMRAAA